ncbi:MAG: glycosyltransferase [Flavobacteriales bacterium]
MRTAASKSAGAHPRGDRSILVLTYWSFDDALVQTYTLPYLRLIRAVLPPGSTIHLVTLEKKAAPGVREVEPGIQVHAFRYVPFGLRAFGMIATVLWNGIKLIRRHGVDTIHAWCTPAGMLGHWLSVLTGKPLIIDSYEPHAEAMVENGTWRREGLAFKLLFWSERVQSRRATVLIAAAEGMKDYAALKYGVTDKRFHVKPACVDLDRFSYADRKDPVLLRELGLEGKLVGVYAGKFGGIYLDREVFAFIRVARAYWGDRFHMLLLTGHSADELAPMMKAEGLPRELFTLRFVPHAEVPRYMGLGDLAITPVRSVPTKRYCTPIKDGEYWALGLPVVITPDISDDSRIIADHGIGAVLSGLGDEHYRSAVERIDHLLRGSDRQALYARIRPIAEEYRNYNKAKAIYQSIYGS